MRHNKIRKQLAKPAKHHSPAEKLHLRRVQRKHGPSAQRRAAHRHEVVKTLDCGCTQERVRFVPCAKHAPQTTVDADDVVAMLEQP